MELGDVSLLLMIDRTPIPPPQLTAQSLARALRAREDCAAAATRLVEKAQRDGDLCKRRLFEAVRQQAIRDGKVLLALMHVTSPAPRPPA